MKFDSVCHTYSQLLGIDTVHVRVLCYAISSNLSYLEMLLKKKATSRMLLLRENQTSHKEKTNQCWKT